MEGNKFKKYYISTKINGIRGRPKPTEFVIRKKGYTLYYARYTLDYIDCMETVDITDIQHSTKCTCNERENFEPSMSKS